MRTGLITLVVCLAFFNKIQAQSAEQLSKSADSLVEKRLYTEAIPLLDRAIKLNPNDQMYYRGRAYIYLRIGKNEESKNDYLKALELNPKCSRCYSRLGWIAHLEGKDQEALELCDKAVAVNDTDAEAYVGRGNIQEALKHVIAAERDFDKAISLKPKETGYLVAKGLFEERGAMHEEAIACYSKGLAINNKTAYLYELRAASLYKLKKYNECMVDLNKAKELGISDIDNWFDLRQMTYVALGQPEKIDAEVDDAINKGIATDNIYYHRGLNRFNKEDMDGACEDFSKALELYNKSEDYRINGPSKEMIELITERCDTNNLGYYYHRGIANYNLHKNERALAYYDLGLRKFKNNALLNSFKGNANMALGNYKEAIANYQISLNDKDGMTKDAAAATNNKNAKEGSSQNRQLYLFGVYESMGECYRNLGEFNKAPEFFDLAIRLKIDNPRMNSLAYSNMALNSFYAGEFEASLLYVGKALSMDNKNVLAYRVGALVKFAQGQKISKKTYSISAGGTIRGNTVFPNTEIARIISTNKSDEEVKSALTYINLAVEYEPQNPANLYIRALIKKTLDYPDYCMDLYQAKELNYIPADDAIKALCR